MSPSQMLESALQQQVENRLKNNPEQRKQIVLRVMEAFARLRKAPVPDIVQRTERLRDRVVKMAENLSVEFRSGNLVVKPSGSSEALLTELRRGTDWYDPEEDIDKIIVAAVMVDPKRS